MLVANAGVSAGRVRRGEADFGDALALSFGILPGIGAAVAGIVDPDTPVQQAGFDIRDEKDREVFQNGADFENISDENLTIDESKTLPK